MGLGLSNVVVLFKNYWYIKLIKINRYKNINRERKIIISKIVKINYFHGCYLCVYYSHKSEK